MIDMHSHILPDIDDGSRNIEETVDMLQEANHVGFTTVVATSHYYLGYYEVEEKERIEHISEVLDVLQNVAPNLKICIGSEIYVNSQIVNLLKEHKASSINGTKYVLFELPFQHQIQNLQDIIYSLLSHKYVPIIAHPERYEYVQKDPNILLNYIDLGVLFQSNYGSVIGQYGKLARKTVTKLLENNFVHFLGSDAHRHKSIYTKIPNALEELGKIISNEKIKEITTINPRLVLENKNIDIDTPIKIKKGLFGF